MNTVWILLTGLPATGKSTLARQLVNQLERCTVLDKDRVRAALFLGPMTDYTAAQDALCMQAMLEAAAYITNNKLADYVIFDGRTFSRHAQIDEVITAAEAAGAGWKILYLTCSDSIAEARLSTHDPEHPAANRNAALYHRVKAEFESITRQKLDLDTTEGVEPVVPRAIAYIRS
jgi:adenylylsulfate kinase